MPKKKKQKLQQKQIQKNTSINVSNTIYKIKANERKYTAILVVFFMVCFGFMGYFAFRIDVPMEYMTVTQSVKENRGIVSSSSTITLSKEENVTEEEGLRTPENEVTIKNNMMETVFYQVKLIEDEMMHEKCGCDENHVPIDSIRYSLDGKEVLTLPPDAVLWEGTLKPTERIRIPLQIWTENMEQEHFHGRIEIIKKASE